MEILDEFYTPSRMRLCSGDGLNCCIRDKNRVCTWFWHTVDIYLSGVWWCSNLLKRNLHSCWGVNSVFCGSQPAGHHRHLWFLHGSRHDPQFHFHRARRDVAFILQAALYPWMHWSIHLFSSLIIYQCFVTASPNTSTCKMCTRWDERQKLRLCFALT